MKVKNIIIVILIVILSILILSGLSSAVLTEGNVLYYSLDEGSGTRAVDNSTNSNNATLYNTPAYVFGKVGPYSLNFTSASSEYANSSRLTNINGTQSRTVSFWGQVTSTASTQMFVSFGNITTDQIFEIGVLGASGNWFIGAIGGNDWDTGIAANTALNFHTITYNSSTVVWYINNAQIASTTRTYVTANSNFTFGSRKGNDFFLNGNLDEIGLWNRTLSSTEISQLYNNGAGLNPYTGTISITINSPLNGTSTANSSILFNASAFVTTNSFRNATLYIYNSSGVFNRTTNLITGSENTTTWNVSGFGLGTYFWHTYFCRLDNVCVANQNFTLSFGATVNSNVYNPVVYQSQVEHFETNITVPSGSSLSNARFIWNNTQYTSNISQSGNNYTLSADLIIPTNVSGSISWFWILDYLGGFQQNLSSNTQTVTTLNLDDCTANPQQILNFTLFDEDLRTTRINGTIEVLVNVYNSDRSALSGMFNKSFAVTTLTTARVCVQSINSTFSMDYQTKYFGNSSYVTEYKFAQAISLSNSTAVQNVNLYNLLDSRSTTFTITLQNPDLSVIQGAVIDVQRQYVPINQFVSVESPLTNNIGEAVAHLVHNEVYYNFVVTKNGELLGTFNNYLVQCQNFATGDCRISLNLIDSIPDIPSFENYGNISGSFTWLRSTRNLFFTFVSTDSNNHNVSWVVSKLDNYGNNTICSTSSVATIGTFQCTIPTLYGNASIMAQVFSDGALVTASTFSLQPSPGDVFGGTRIVLAIIMYGTLTLLMIGHPIAIVMGAILGMIMASAFHLVDGGSFIGNASIILWFIIAGVIVIFYMRNKT